MDVLVKQIAEGLEWIDSTAIPFRNYQPGVGPYGEPQVVGKILGYLRDKYPRYYKNAAKKRIPDVLIPNEWALEFKIIRPFGDNGKEAEHWSQNLIHPYEGNVSSLGDAIKLLNSDFFERKRIIVISYEHNPPIIHVETLIECFELIAGKILNISLGRRISENIKGLVHPIHQQCTVYGWEIIQ